jgi:hypothetical protein
VKLPFLRKIIVLVSLWHTTLWAQQIPMGQWRLHPSFTDTRLCEATENYIYASSEKGFFRVNTANADVQRLSGMDGFHGREITSLEYTPNKKILVIGYSDGFIDLLKNETTIIAVPGFFNELLQGDKRILHTSFIDNDALLSTNFGILVIDLIKNEIRENYKDISPTGQTQPVLSTAVFGDSIYAGIPDGIIAAKYADNVNLKNYLNWKKVFAGGPGLQLCSFADSLYFYKDSNLLRYKNGVATISPTSGKNSVQRIKVFNGRMHVFRPGGITRQSVNGSRETEAINLIASGTCDAADFIWYCTGFGGGIIKKSGGNETAFEPNGPSSNSVFAMSKSGEYLFTSGGGVTNTFGNAYNPAGFYIYNNFRWTSNPASTFNTGLYDYTFLHYNKVTDKYYLATHTNGMLEFKGTQATNRFDETNAPFFRETTGSGFIRISGMASDEDGNLWVNNYGSSKPLLVMSRSGTWTALEITDAVNLKNVVVDENGYKWMIVLSNGLLVYDDNKTPSNPLDDRSIRLTTGNGLITNEVLSLAADLNGYVWIGTTQGLNVVTNTFEVFTKPKIDRFVIEQDGNTGYLLGEESINDICVDGGNRKWFATNNGAFLVEPNGQEVLGKFRTENSPLPDNRIYCVGQVASSGEVFFGTDAGIASFRSDASEADETFGKIKIYPNPVKPGYTGSVTIEGLARDAEIRITDATGNLIYQTKANGGTATWPCTRLDGSRPNSGVFYVFGINTEGTETSMGKFVFIQ